MRGALRPVSYTHLCAVMSHNAGGYAFYKSAEHHRITRFRANAVPLDRPGPVSYTHLDVYKRQGLWDLLNASESPLSRASEPLAIPLPHCPEDQQSQRKYAQRRQYRRSTPPDGEHLLLPQKKRSCGDEQPKACLLYTSRCV